MKQTIKLREYELKRMIAESVKRVLNEVTDDTTDGALDYQGSPKHKDFMFKRGQFYGSKSGKEIEKIGSSTFNGHDDERIEKLNRYNGWDGKSTHGVPKAALFMQLKDDILDLFYKVSDNFGMMNLSETEEETLSDIQEKLKSAANGIHSLLKGNIYYPDKHYV
jgi:hypothetical protein